MSLLERGECRGLPEVDEEQGWEEVVLVDEGAVPEGG